jgi:hypothetical protein
VVVGVMTVFVGGGCWACCCCWASVEDPVLGMAV